MADPTPEGAPDGPQRYMRQELEEIISKKFKKFTKLPCAECGVAACKRFCDSGPLVVKAMLDTFWCGECGRLLCESHRHAHTCERADAKKEALASMAPEKLRERMEEEKRQKAAAEEAAKAPQRAAAAAADERRRRRHVIAEKTQLVANFIQLASREEGRSDEEIERLLGCHAKVQRILTFLWNEFESPTLPGIAEKEWDELKQIYWSVTESINVVVAVPQNGDWEQPDDWVELDMTNDWEEGAGPPTKTVLQPTMADARALGNRLRQEAVPAQEMPAPRAAEPPAAAPAQRDAPAAGGVVGAAGRTTGTPAAAPEPATASRDAAEDSAEPTTVAAPASAARTGTASSRQAAPQPVLPRSMPRPLTMRLVPEGGIAGRAKAGGRGFFGAPGLGKGIAGRGKGSTLVRPTMPPGGKGRSPVSALLGQNSVGYPINLRSSRAGVPSASVNAEAAAASSAGKRTEAAAARPAEAAAQVTRSAPKPPERELEPSRTQAASNAWTVVGGADTRGILVREGQGLQTPELGRLSAGAVVEELEQREGRLQYRKVSGDGPEQGWVSLAVKGKELLRKINGAE